MHFIVKLESWNNLFETNKKIVVLHDKVGILSKYIAFARLSTFQRGLYHSDITVHSRIY